MAKEKDVEVSDEEEASEDDDEVEPTQLDDANITTEVDTKEDGEGDDEAGEDGEARELEAELRAKQEESQDSASAPEPSEEDEEKNKKVEAKQKGRRLKRLKADKEEEAQLSAGEKESNTEAEDEDEDEKSKGTEEEKEEYEVDREESKEAEEDDKEEEEKEAKAKRSKEVKRKRKKRSAAQSEEEEEQEEAQEEEEEDSHNDEKGGEDKGEGQESSSDEEDDEEDLNIFENIVFYFPPSKERRDLIALVKTYGGDVLIRCTPDANEIVVPHSTPHAGSMTTPTRRSTRVQKSLPRFVCSHFVYNSVKTGQKLNSDDYLLPKCPGGSDFEDIQAQVEKAERKRTNRKKKRKQKKKKTEKTNNLKDKEEEEENSAADREPVEPPSSYPKGTRNYYTLADKAAILKYVEKETKGRNNYSLKGLKFWRLALKKKVTNHSYMSMQDHYRRVLATLTPSQKKKIIEKAEQQAANEKTRKTSRHKGEEEEDDVPPSDDGSENQSAEVSDEEEEGEEPPATKRAKPTGRRSGVAYQSTKPPTKPKASRATVARSSRPLREEKSRQIPQRGEKSLSVEPRRKRARYESSEEEEDEVEAEEINRYYERKDYSDSETEEEYEMPEYRPRSSSRKHKSERRGGRASAEPRQEERAPKVLKTGRRVVEQAVHYLQRITGQETDTILACLHIASGDIDTANGLLIMKAEVDPADIWSPEEDEIILRRSRAERKGYFPPELELDFEDLLLTKGKKRVKNRYQYLRR